ncbi:MAG TPA: amino acid adenylation domain-containing protein [Ktedonobacteraceae bacterium]|jgi:amino acid adenylation domain-containing protein
MDTSKKFSCFILGEGTLPIQCAQILVDHEHTIYGIISSNQAVIDWAQRREIPYIDPQDKDIVIFLSQHPFDYLFSIVSQYILPKQALELPRRCAINYHNAPLPRYAGSNVTSWAIMQGERIHGVTWHAMTELVDAGNIFKQHLFEIDDKETALTLDAKCYDAALSSFAELIDDISCDHVSARTQNLSERTFFLRNKKPSSGCLLSWNRSARDIDAFVRALDFGSYLNPMGLPKLAIEKDFIIVSEVEVLNSISAIPPGTVTHIDPSFVRVSTIDGEIALRKLLTIDGQPLSIPDFAVKFGQYEGYQFKELDQEIATRITAYHTAICQHEAFWAKQLETLEKITLPYVHRKTPHIQSARNLYVPMPVPKEVLNLLENRYVTWRIGDFLQAAFVAYLARIGMVESFDIGYSDIELKSDLAGLEGIFATDVPLHMIIEHAKSFEEIFDVVQEQVKLAKKRKTYARDIMARYPALRSKASLQEYLPSVFIERLEVLHDYKAPHGSELTLVIQEDGIECFWFYNEEVFNEENIVEMQHGFTTFLQSIVSDPQQRISHLPLLTKAERHCLLIEWNATKNEYPLEQCLHQLFEAQVVRTPEAIAVIYEDEQLSYQELNAHANRLAHQLREHGVGPESLVALLAERGIPFLVSILAVFKTGGAYLPLDPHYPPARLCQLIELSQCSIILAMTAFAPTLTYVLEEVSAGLCPEILYYEEVLQASQNEENLPVSSTPRDLAYVIYTSGSMGQPKGAMVEQRGMLNHIYAKIDALALTDQDTVVQTASQCFVISVWQFLAALLVGGRVQIYPDEVAHNPVQLLTQVEHHQISILEIVPSLMRAMLDADQIKVASGPKLEALRWLIPTGEVLPVELCQHWLRNYSHVPLLNAYGSSESSDDVAHYPIYEAPEEMRSSVPIGRVIPNMQLYVLDRHLEPLPIGVSGELYVGGIGVGRGYLGDEQRTKASFVANPFGSEDGAQLYKSGDLVHYLPDGNLEFLGRLDHQVKIRGVRIELGEIEVVLMQHPNVEQAVVVAREDALDDKRLVAYIVPHQGQAVGVSDLRSHVMNQLPTYMVPSAFVLLETLPLTYNGKVDRRALPVPEYTSSELESSLVMPQTPLQEAIAASWVQVLRIAQVGIHDNFFTLGGHSLLAMQVLARLRRALQVELPLHRFFAAPTIAQLSKIFEQVKASNAQLQMSAPHPLSREAHRVKLSSILPRQDSSDSRDKNRRKQ